jgi:protein gp37
MAEKSEISWTKSTFNPWIGCTRVGPGCDHCYAEAMDARKRWGGGVVHWGPGVPRMRTKPANWSKPLKWDKAAALERSSGKRDPKDDWKGPIGFWPVFCASLADVFDNEVADEWRTDLWALIESTPHLAWQLVTKRVGNVMKMVPEAWRKGGLPAHVVIIATVVNQEEFDRDWPKLREIPARWRGLSVEPMLGPIRFLPQKSVYGKLHWVIFGGESNQGGHKARPCDLSWIWDGIDQCRELDIAPFVKQLGSHPLDVPGGTPAPFEPPGMKWKLLLKDKAGADPAEWPARLRVQEYPI